MIWKRSGHCSNALDKPAFLQAQIDCKLGFFLRKKPLDGIAPGYGYSGFAIAAALNHNGMQAARGRKTGACFGVWLLCNRVLQRATEYNSRFGCMCC
jgi:hypothetical protein